MRIRNVARHEN